MELRKTEGYHLRAVIIRSITERHYEPGRHDRCLKMIWRRHIRPQFGICYHTYLRYIKYLAQTEQYDRSCGMEKPR